MPELDEDMYQSLVGGGENHTHWHSILYEHKVLENIQELYKIVPVSANYTMDLSDDIVVADTTSGNITITLPPSKGLREFIAVKAKAANLLTVNFSGVENCFGATSFSVVALGDTLKFKCYNGGWIKL